MGIMEEIKQHLESGLSVKEIKELGFKAPSIYKVKKQMKENKKEEMVTEKKESEPFQEVEEVDEVPETVLDNNSIGLNNPDPSSSNLPDNQETKEEPLIEELFGDDTLPFQDFNEVDINRDHVNVSSLNEIHKSESKILEGTGKLGVAELIAQVYSLIGITTGHDHWEVSPKEQKVLKNLCKIPVLESALHKFGLYGCVISLVTMTLKRIKIEMQLKKSDENKKEDQENRPEPVFRPDSPSTVMGLLEA